ncbi:MarR family transcriptional regulator [Sphingomonas sp. CL5.1]|uniref:MarR family winged helix-turn-helix transcriptional regulator n=1 Tax=Sphingomonas sp. CL5.1 TaxID=2653203 RepID=UPI0015822138|nr:helix-turn-helix domain-containing protein [Sphingomonas sp. CL5.1]QKS00322.1 MarR family transcriptional regulator [Sphingomonas sp. CL5.1]
MIQLLDELARMRGRTAVAFRDIRVMHGFTEIENVVLTAVTGAKIPPTVPQIGRSLDHPRQVIQRAADALVARGLIVWRDNPDHKRARLLVATEEGDRLRHLADLAGLERAGQLVGTLDPALVATTVAGLRTIREAIEENIRSFCERTPSAEREDT